MRSADWACIHEGVHELECPPTHASREGASPALQWSAIIVGIPVFNSASEELLLVEVARTWLPLVRGADVVVTTDWDDPRSDERISGLLLPAQRVHVHRCRICCSGGHVPPGRQTRPALQVAPTASDVAGCDGLREAWAARTKVLHMIAEVARRFGVAARRETTAVAEAAEPKRFFLKVDPDTLIHPANLMRLLTRLAPVGRSQPILLGLAACRSEPLPSLCHAAGGAGYVLSIAAVDALGSFVHDVYEATADRGEAWLAHLDRSSYGGEDVAVALALKERTGASVVNCGGFHQHRADEYMMGRMDGIQWPQAEPVSFHNFKSAPMYRRFFDCALYSEHKAPTGDGTGAAHVQGQREAVESRRPRCFIPAAEALLRHQKCAAFMADDDERCVVQQPNHTLLNPHSRPGFRLKARDKASRKPPAVYLAEHMARMASASPSAPRRAHYTTS